MTGAFDILIVGGGMVGASLARSLSGLGLRLGVIEAHSIDSALQPSYDDRVIALAWGSRLILQGLGVWPALAGNAEPIKKIHISDRGHFAFAHLSAEEEGVEALGYVASARALGAALFEGVDKLPDVQLICPAQLQSFRVEGSGVLQVELEHNGEPRQLQARLLVAADGGDSLVRRSLDVPVREWAYGQSAIIANVTPGRPHANVAYERFTDTGPLAMLPMKGDSVSVVWTARDDQVDEIMAWSDAEFLDRLQTRFGYRLGRFLKAGKRVAYPLRLMRAKEQVRPRVVLIGNAAHAVHPVAGQGFNLGIRDVAVLADVLADAARAHADPGAMEVLKRYEDWRRWDQRKVGLITDGLARLFANPLMPLRVARDAGLLAFDMLPGVKRPVGRQFMGLSGRLPRLARGLPVAR